ncbi:hypothetical protein [Aureimonas sp. AU40]|uniref:hypothetical protein n=1 Tax=Aureimonas sp. AU40 TaxID=1637747 RepID=UPI000780D5B5|nr:hypothetical protein [Aureimonas sp. AU40]
MSKRTAKNTAAQIENVVLEGEIIAPVVEQITETNEPTEAELDAIETAEVQSEAYQAQASEIDEVNPDQAPAGDEPELLTDEPEQKTLAQMIEGIERDHAVAMQHHIAAEIDDRMDYESDKGNETIQRSLKSSRAKMTTDLLAAYAFAATSVDPSVFNVGRASTNRYNVYAIDKVADLARSLASGHFMKNAINRAVCRSLFTFRHSGERFTMEIAKAACSDKIRVSPAISRHLIRHTVSASTAPTQASSTMQALETLGIVKNVGTARGAVYELTDTAQARALEELCTKAA